MRMFSLLLQSTSSVQSDQMVSFGVIVGICFALVEIIKSLIPRITNGRKEEKFKACIFSDRNQFQSTVRKIDDLYRWHDQTDSDGVKVWYVRKSLESAIEGLANSVEKQSLLMEKIANQLEDVNRRVREVDISPVPPSMREVREVREG